MEHSSPAPIDGTSLYRLAAELYPICRSITGNGVRQTLAILGQHIPLAIHEVASGTPVFDWVVPNEWNLRQAYVEDMAGRRVIDARNCNLHVVSYSRPIRDTMSLAELKKHLHTLPDQPDLIPYRTTYYADNWGFCLSHNELQSLADGDYRVVIDATLEPGSLTYGEYLHRGESEDEIILSTHICHPSLANDNCSGLAVLALLAKSMAETPTRYSYRFLFAPGTIGAITWLARNEAHTNRIAGGLVVSCLGDRGSPTYKKSRRGDALIDQAMQHVLRHAAAHSATIDFSPYGYDERQFCSPGFNLPVGMLQRSQFGTFPEYHTSADNLDFIAPEPLHDSCRLIQAVIDIFERNDQYLNLQPKCEPQLGRRGLYGAIGGDKNAPANNMAMLWVLNLSDGEHSLLDIANRADLPFGAIFAATKRLESHGLLRRLGRPAGH